MPCKRRRGKYREATYLPGVYRNAAKRLRERDGELEIDPDATVDLVPEERGAYVACWLWIDDGDIVDA